MPAARAAWMHDARWGIFLHLLAGPAGSGRGAEVDAAVWDRRIGGYDVGRLADQAAAAGAGWVGITVGQNSGHYGAPNPVYDALTGIRPSRCSRRDLIADLGAALRPRGIRLIAYLPSGAPEHDPAAVAALGWRKGGRCAAFQTRWEDVIRCWSERWGRAVDGWWFDGCYWNDAMYRQPDAPNFASFAAAARAGNPEAALAWNPGVSHPPRGTGPDEDYTAGEVNDPDAFDPPGRTVDGEQFHVLSYLGQTWGQGPLRYAPDEAARLTRTFTDPGGAVTWDVPLDADGAILDAALPALAAIGVAVGPTRGRPDRMPEPAPWPEVAVRRSPEAGRPGLASIRLVNRHDRRIAGRVRLRGEPAAAVHVADPVLDYDLAPGGETAIETAVAIDVPAASPALLVERLADGRTLRTALPVRQRFVLPRVAPAVDPAAVADVLAAVPARTLTGADGRALAELRLGRGGGDLLVHLRAFQAEPRQTTQLWDGSCLELFACADDGPGRQLILAPAAGGQAERVVLVEARRHADPLFHPAGGVRLASRRGAGGWEVAALVDLAWWLGGPVEGGFRLDAIVGADGRAALSGNLGAAQGSGAYAQAD